MKATAPHKLSSRAKILKYLERWFPVVNAPTGNANNAEYEYAKASLSYNSFVTECQGIEGKKVLDFGCGWGGETVWLAHNGAQAFGCDISEQAIATAQHFAENNSDSPVQFDLVVDNKLPYPDNTFDAIFSTNVFEHVMDPTSALSEIHRVLKPGGTFYSNFGPLFYSPLGYHLPWVTQVPYAHLLFGLKPILELRNQIRDSISPKSWEDTGLNRMKYQQFRHAVNATGLEIDRLNRIPVKQLKLLAAIPFLGDLFTFGIDCKLTKPTSKFIQNSATNYAKAA